MATKLKNYSTTPGSNNSAPPDGWPEGMLPSAVNNSARELMARAAEWYQDAEWILRADTVTAFTGSTLTITGDVTSKYTVDRAIRLDESNSKRGIITGSSFSSPSTTVTITGYTILATPTAVEIGIIDSSKNGIVTIAGTQTVTGAKTFSGAVTLGSTVNGEAGVLLQGKHTVPVLASAMFSRATNGAAPGLTELATNDVMLATKDFDQTTSEGAQFYVPMPKSWNEGTVTAQFGWTAASGTGTVTWAIAGSAFSDDDALDAAFGTAQSVTDTLITANDMHITSATSAITIAGTPAESDFVIFQITRDIADTLNADAKLIWCKVFITYNAGNDA